MHSSATTSLLSLRHRSYSVYSPLRGEYQTAGGIGRRGIGLRTRLLVSSRARLALGDCVLTVDDITRSSAILCFTFCKIALPLRRALPPDEVSSGVRTALLALCPSQAVVVIPLTRASSVRPSNIDYSTHRPLGALHRPPVYPTWPSGA